MSGCLEVKELTVQYGAFAAVSCISFTVEAGSVTSLVGANGAGKTSTVRAISGIIPAGGKVTLDGECLLSRPPEARVGLGLAHVLEGRHVFPRMTVIENLRLGAYCRKDGRENEMIEEIEELFPRLVQGRGQLAGSLSVGDQQMLAIGRALMSSPRLLIMDEPTMDLSPQMIDIIVDAIDRLRKQGLTMLLVGQNALDTIQMSDKVVALRLGQIVDQGPAKAFDVERLTSIYLDYRSCLSQRDVREAS